VSAPTPSWYDVLGVEPDAGTDEIRAAWKAAIADLDPTDRRFRSLNAAAEVLLDPVRRAEHDEALAADDEAAAGAEPVISPGEVPAQSPQVDAPPQSGKQSETQVVAEPETPASTRGLLDLAADLRTVVVLAVLALALVVATVLTGGDDEAAGSSDGLPDTRDIAAARAAAEAAIGPVLSYDYRRLDDDRAAALAYLSPDQAERYDTFFEGVVKENAATTQTVVSVRVLASGIVRTGPDRVDVLLFINRPTTNKQGSNEYKDQVTAQMREIDGEWLVDCLITQPGRGCSDS